jgi:hypothetical protein
VLETVRNFNGDWRPALPTNEGQLMKVGDKSYGDTNACVSFSASNVCETMLNWLIQTGQMPTDSLNFLKSNGYIDAGGKINFSDRFLAKMSGTDPNVGNTLQAVWDSIRHNGMVPESMWPAPTSAWQLLLNVGDYSLPDFWARYYAPVPQEVVDAGKRFTKWFETQYEWMAWNGHPLTMPQLADALKVAPLQIATAVCPGWNTDNPINACGPGGAHATTMVNVEPGAAYDIYDHYNPFSKRFSANYTITAAMRGVMLPIKQVPVKVPPFTHDYQRNLQLGDADGPEVHAMQQGLQALGFMRAGLFGPYGPQTQAAVAKFQIANKIANTPQGSNFGPKSRAALTNALAFAAQVASGEPLPRPLHWDA